MTEQSSSTQVSTVDRFFSPTTLSTLTALASVLVPLAMLNLTLSVFSLWKLTVFLVIVIFMAAVALAMAVRSGVWQRFRSPLDQPFFVLTVIVVLSTLTSVYPVISIRGNYEWMLGALFFLALWIFFRLSLPGMVHAATRLKVVRWMTLTAAVISIYAILQAFGIDIIEWSSQGTFDISRASSTFGNPLPLGLYLAFVIPLIIYMLTLSKEAGVRSDALITLPLAQAALLFTYSRGALLAELVGILILGALWVIFLRSEIRRLVMPALLLAAGAIFFLAFSGSMEEVETSTSIEGQILSGSTAAQQSLAVRVELAKNSYEMVSDRPLLGFGLGTFGYIQPGYRTADQVIIEGGIHYPVSSHDELLDLTVSLGVLGLLAFLFLNVTAAACCFRTVRRSELTDGDPALALACLASITAFIAGSTTTFGNIGVYVIYGVVLSIAVGAAGLVREGAAIPLRFKNPGLISIGVGIITVFALIAVLRPVVADMFYRQGYIAQRTDAVKGSELIGRAEAIDSARPLYQIESAYSFVKLAFDPQNPDLTNEAVKFGLSSLTELSEKYPYERDIYVKLANVYVDAGELKKAEQGLRDLERYDRDGVEANYLSGKLAEARGNTASARRSYERVLELHPKNVPALRRLAIIEITEGDHSKAEKHLETILLLEPNDQEASRLLSSLKKGKLQVPESSGSSGPQE